MEEMACLWSYEESIDEMTQKLLYSIVDLESVKTESNEELRKNKEYVKQLLQLLNITYQERDEARDQLQKLLNKVMSSPTPVRVFTPFPQLQPEKPESPSVKPTKANSSITESNSFSDAYNHQTHTSSPVDSFFYSVSSPELSNINIGDSNNVAFVDQPLAQDYNGTISTRPVFSGSRKTDQASLIIENLAKGKILTQKGKFLQAVLEAGPLLQTLLVSGPLPRWRNPPPLQPFHIIPPVTINSCESCDAKILTHKPAADSSHIPKSLSSQSYVDLMSFGSSQMLSTSMLNFDNGSTGSYMGNGELIPAVANTHSYISSACKRQKFQ